MRRNDRATVHRVSGVRSGLSEDIRNRQRRYLLSMSVRTICFIAAIVTPAPWRWFFFAAALVLPYIAVVVANGGREPTRTAPPPVDLPVRGQISPRRPGEPGT